MSKEGIPIDNFDPKPEIRKNAENARDWEYRDEAQYLYGMAVLFKDRFLDPVLHTDRGRLPDPVISFDDLRNRRTLAAYILHRNPQGLLDEITFNTAHYVDEEGQKVWAWGRWAQLETLLHEQVHLWQENFGKHKHKPGRVAHDKEFVEKCESLGLHPIPVIGAHHAVADGVFAGLMAELGIPRPEDVPREKGEKKDWFRPGPEKGRSTLHKWECPDCGLKVRVGIKGDPGLVHHVCSEKKGEKVFFVRSDGLTHVIYEGNEEERPLKDTPEIIKALNQHLKAGIPEDTETPTVEDIALKLGVNKSTLYDWVKNDKEFSQTLERLKTVQENDPFKTGAAEDSRVNSMMIALLLMEKAKSKSEYS
jgi:transposase-like protein